MTGSLQIKKGNYYAVYRDDSGKQKWIPLNLSAEGNNKRKAQQKLRDVLAEAEKNRSVITSNIQFRLSALSSQAQNVVLLCDSK